MSRIYSWSGCALWALCIAAPGPFAAAVGQSVPATINLNLDMKHQVVTGSTTSETFDREKFITLHAISSEADWWGGNPQSRNQPNVVPNLLADFVTQYDVYFGRDSGTVGFTVTQVAQDPMRPGYADPASVAAHAALVKNYGYLTAAQQGEVRKHEYEKRMKSWVLVAGHNPFFPIGYKVSGAGCGAAGSWSFSQADTAAEPIGTATGDFLGHYLRNGFSQTPPVSSGSTGHPEPRFVEAVNEPLYNLVDVPPAGCAATSYGKIFKYHTGVRNRVRAIDTASTVQVGGYTVAFPDFEETEHYPVLSGGGNSALFGKWNTRDALWLSNHAKQADFISLHIYDFDAINFDGRVRQLNHKGNNLEATLDTLDSAMLFASGALKPLVISEYGGRRHVDESKPWTAQRDWAYIKAMNSLLVQFLERPTRISKAVPFVPLKAEWGRHSESVPYEWRLLRQQFEQPGQSGNAWTYTELVKFYQQWQGVKGTRLDSWASDQDVQVDAYYDNASRAVFLIINNLEAAGKSINLKTFGLNGGNSVANVEYRHLYPNTATGVPVLDVYSQPALPATVTVGSESTLILKVTYNNALNVGHTNIERKYFAPLPAGSTSALRAIVGGQPMTFVLNNVVTGANGEGVLRISVGRPHSLAWKPASVSIRNVATNVTTTLAVPDDYRGYDQNNGGNGRRNFFGTLEIPVPRAAIGANNIVTVTYAAGGGSISAVSLQNFVTSRQVPRG